MKNININELEKRIENYNVVDTIRDVRRQLRLLKPDGARIHITGNDIFSMSVIEQHLTAYESISFRELKIKRESLSLTAIKILTKIINNYDVYI